MRGHERSPTTERIHAARGYTAAMTKNHGVAIVALLALLAVLFVHRSYIRKPEPLRFEYRATEAPAIDLAALQRAGAEGWNCTAIPIVEGANHHFIMFCKRESR